jgi:Phage tail repeat like
MTYLTSIGGSSGSASWGSIGGSISSQSDLQTLLNGKANTSHTHAQSDITNLTTDLSGKADAIHTHTQYEDKWTYTTLGSNSTVSTTAFANVSGMSFSASANTKYLVTLNGAYQTAATTTGISLALDIPTGATIIGQNVVSTSATALGGTEQLADATTTGASTGVRAINTNTPIQSFWIVSVGGTAGTIQLMQRSEIAASNTVLQATLTVMGYRAI